MHRALLAPVAAVLLLAGCVASGDADPFAYTRKPLYAGGFDLARIAGGSDAQEFRVTDGSIPALRVQVWINATAGDATLSISDPGGRARLVTSQTTERTLGLDLGVWGVGIEASPGAAGLVHVLVTRA